MSVPKLDKKERAAVGDLIRQAREARGLSAAEFVQELNGHYPRRKTLSSLMPWDITAIELRGQGLEFLPFIAILMAEGILDPGKAVADVCDRGRSKPTKKRARKAGARKVSKR